MIVLTVPAFTRLGSEFMPPLNEGSILYMPTAPPGMSESEASRILTAMDKELKAFPEVASVFGKSGRAETPTDPAPLGMFETTIVLKPRDQWRPGMTWDRLVREMDEKLQWPGMPNIWWMPIQTRTEMLATGVRSPLAIEVYGDDLATIERASVAIERALGGVPGTRSVYAERLTGGFYVDVVIKRAEAARFGLHGRRHRRRGRGRDRRRQGVGDRRGPRALPDQRALRARAARRPQPRSAGSWSGRRPAPRSRCRRSPTSAP